MAVKIPHDNPDRKSGKKPDNSNNIKKYKFNE